MDAVPTPVTDTDLGRRIRAARTARGRTLREIAAAIGVSTATLSLIENGRTGLRVARLAEIADALGLEITDLLTDETPTPKPHPRPVAVGILPEDGDWRRYDPLVLDPVLAAALDEIVEVGYHGATIRSIARRCGSTASALYVRFDGKQQILMTLQELAVAAATDRGAMARADGRTPVERFRFLVEHLALLHTYRRDLAFIGTSELRSLEPENRRRIAGRRTDLQHMVDDEVAAAVRDGVFRPDHPHEASRAVVTMCTAISGWWRPGGQLSPEQVAQLYVGFALDLMRSELR
ncbi:helix-turn-helix domain-containing protein [Gordonia neofelifaecis]|uniref:Putative transcriptional regulator n=1 Tax=Gordonia neofelifaecis NRRL B-59395 TaxID=644548 RepID=F1YMI3_9ACTN|nr:helix-turn-helix domain-containing protein [Gordonia neofelifaecis]EGD54108.1 putative transcriptional regulator [Gordonia neofelifaecis NRRL B-59395]